MKTIAIVALSTAALAVAATMQTPGQTIAVPAGGDLQDAINRAQPGDTITLDAGATYSGNFVLPAKDGNTFITIRTAETEGLPGPDTRIDPTNAPSLAKLKSPNSQPAMRTDPHAHHWRLELLEFQANATGSSDILLLGDGSGAQRDLDIVPRDLVVDRIYMHGDPNRSTKRGIALNSAATNIINSYISDIKAVGQDSQALGGWNGPGPYLIDNNYLEAAGENFMMGGSDALIPNLVPSDITFRKNHLAKPLEWRRSQWSVKNLFELKNARRVLVENNVLEYNWQAGQPGFAIVLTPRNSNGNSPWSTVEDITFRSNVVRHVAAVFNVLGTDDARPSGPARRITVQNNLFFDVDQSAWGGNGVFMQLGDGPSDVSVDHNTIVHTGNLISAYGGTKDKPTPIVGFDFENNVARHNTYGVFGAGRSPGMDTLSTFFPGAIFTHNVLAGGKASRYPGGNLFPSVADFDRQFADPKDGDFHLIPSSTWKGAASDGGDLGANIDALGQLLDNLGFRERPDRPRPGRGRGGIQE